MPLKEILYVDVLAASAIALSVSVTANYIFSKSFALLFVPIYNFMTRKIFLEKKLCKEDKL